jgi:hypothetical protein
MEAKQHTEKTPKKVRVSSLAVGLSAVAVVSLGGGYVLGATNMFATPKAGATSDHSGQNGHRNKASGKDIAYITDAAEMYLSQKGVNPDMMRVSKVMVQGDYAVGGLDGGDSGSVFFAQKIDGVWSVLYSGQDITPEAMEMLKQAGFPEEWLTSPFKSAE